MFPRCEMLDLVVINGKARGIVTRHLETGKVESFTADAVHKAARPMDNTSGTISQRKVASRVLTERALVSLRDPGAWGAAPPKR